MSKSGAWRVRWVVGRAVVVKFMLVTAGDSGPNGAESAPLTEGDGTCKSR